MKTIKASTGNWLYNQSKEQILYNEIFVNDNYDESQITQISVAEGEEILRLETSIGENEDGKN